MRKWNDCLSRALGGRMIATPLFLCSLALSATAEPVCVDYSTYGTEGPIPDELNVDGFLVRDVDRTMKSRIEKGFGLALSGAGVIFTLPKESSSVTLNAATYCGDLQLMAQSKRGDLVGSATIESQRDGQTLADHNIPVVEGSTAFRIFVFGGCSEGQVKSICIKDQ